MKKMADKSRKTPVDRTSGASPDSSPNRRGGSVVLSFYSERVAALHARALLQRVNIEKHRRTLGHREAVVHVVEVLAIRDVRTGQKRVLLACPRDTAP